MHPRGCKTGARTVSRTADRSATGLTFGGLGLRFSASIPFSNQDRILLRDFVGHRPAALRVEASACSTLPPVPGRATPLHEVRYGGRLNWRAYAYTRGTVYDAYEHATGRPDRRYFLSGNLAHCRVFVRASASSRGIPRSAKFSFPYLTRPVIEVIWARLLPRHDGLFLHALGLGWNGKGLVFIGRSGAGKSTLASIFSSVPGASVLNDDRTIVRRSAGRLQVFGTPWHGQFKECAPGPVPLHAVFTIRHGARNTARLLSPNEAVPGLLLGLLGPRWSRTEAERTARLGARIAAAVPCYELCFVNDARVVDCVRDIINA